MAKIKKNKIEKVEKEIINKPDQEVIETSMVPAGEIPAGLVKITSLNKNFRFGIYWLDQGKTREFTKRELQLYKNLEFDEEVKKGNIKIEY